MKKVAQVLGVLVAGAVMLAAIGGLVFAGVSAGKTPSAPVVAADEKVGDAPGAIPGGNYEPTATVYGPIEYVDANPDIVRDICDPSYRIADIYGAAGYISGYSGVSVNDASVVEAAEYALSQCY